MTIKPVGRPLPAIAVKRPYGPAKPVPLPPGFGSGPPGPIYSGQSGHFSGPNFGPPPSFSGPPPPHFSGPPASFGGPYPGYKKPSIHHGAHPVYESNQEGEYDFEDKFIEKKQVIVQQPTASGVQQHVHHHFHHGDDKAPNVVVGTPGLAGPIINPGPIGGNGLNSYGYGSSGTYGGSFNDFEGYKKAFKIKTPSTGNSLDPLQSGATYANNFASYDKPKRDSIFGKGFSSGGSSGKVLNSGFGAGNSFGNTGFGAGSNGFNSGHGLGSASNQFGHGSNSGFGSNGGLGSNGGFGSNGIGSGLGASNGFESGLSSNNYDDCICVPYDQCAGLDQAGRKDDLFLAIDPRNLGKDIEAETVEVVVTDSNGTMSVLRVPKGVNETDQAEHTKEQSKTSGVDTQAEKKSSGEAVEKRTKRDAKHAAEAKDKSADAQGVSSR